MQARSFGLRFRPLALGAIVALGACQPIRQLSNVQPVSLTTGIVSGRVLDDRSGQPAPDASVLLLAASGDTLRDDQQHGAQTSPSDGTFRFVNVRPGTYRMRASAPSFTPATSDSFTVAVNEVVKLELRLRQANAGN